jgi:hypothetical protein
MAAQAMLGPADAVGGIVFALRTFVFQNAELKALCARAKVVSKETRFPFYTVEDFELADFELADRGWLFGIWGHDDLLLRLHFDLPLQEQPAADDYDLLAQAPLPGSAADDDDISVLDKYVPKMPTEIRAAYAAVDASFHLLFGMLRMRQLVAWGVAADGHLVPIPETIWSRGDFFLHPETGDVWEAGTPGNLTVMWIGIVLRLPETAAAPAKVATTAARPPARLTRGEAAVHVAVTTLWPTGVPVGLRTKERNEQIKAFLAKRSDLSDQGPRTINRYFVKTKKPVVKRPKLSAKVP